MDIALYQEHEHVARERMNARDIEDWPVVAVAILLSFPIWTEDQDSSGAGLLPGRRIGSNCICKVRKATYKNFQERSFDSSRIEHPILNRPDERLANESRTSQRSGTELGSHRRHSSEALGGVGWILPLTVARIVNNCGTNCH